MRGFMPGCVLRLSLRVRFGIGAWLESLLLWRLNHTLLFKVLLLLETLLLFDALLSKALRWLSPRLHGVFLRRGFCSAVELRHVRQTASRSGILHGLACAIFLRIGHEARPWARCITSARLWRDSLITAVLPVTVGMRETRRRQFASAQIRLRRRGWRTDLRAGSCASQQAHIAWQRGRTCRRRYAARRDIRRDASGWRAMSENWSMEAFRRQATCLRWARWRETRRVRPQRRAM